MENRPGAPKASIDESVSRIEGAASDAVGEVKTIAADAVDAAKQAIKGAAEDVKTKAADQTRSASHTLRDTATGLDGDLPWMNTALNKAADGFDHLSEALNRGDVGQTLDAVKEFARRQPALFLGLSVAAGFALARVGKTAVEQQQDASPSTKATRDNLYASAPEL